jgi:hypothetical protein
MLEEIKDIQCFVMEYDFYPTNYVFSWQWNRNHMKWIKIIHMNNITKHGRFFLPHTYIYNSIPRPLFRLLYFLDYQAVHNFTP